MRGHRDPQKRMHSFEQSIIATKLLARVGFDALSNLPHSLPEPIRSDFRSKVQAHLDVVERNGLPWKELPDGSWEAIPKIVDEAGGLVNDIAFLVFFSPEDKQEHMLRQQLPLEQSLIMYFAHLDALLQDLFQVACHKDPRHLSSNKQVSFEAVIRSGTWESLVRDMIEKLVFELGCKSLEEKIKLIERTLHLKLQVPEGLLNNLKLAEQGRHTFVHNGGFVTPTIVSRLKTEEYEAGDRLSLSPEYCDCVSEGVLAFGHLTYQAIAAKFWPDLEARTATKSTSEAEPSTQADGR